MEEGAVRGVPMRGAEPRESPWHFWISNYQKVSDRNDSSWPASEEAGPLRGDTIRAIARQSVHL